MAAKKRDLTSLIILGIFITGILYVVGTLYTGGEVQFQNLTENTAFTFMKILIIGLVVYFGYSVATKVKSSAMSKRDFYTMAVIALVLWYVLDKALPMVIDLEFGVLDKATAGLMSVLGII